MLARARTALTLYHSICHLFCGLGHDRSRWRRHWATCNTDGQVRLLMPFPIVGFR